MASCPGECSAKREAEALRITKFRASLCDGLLDDGLDDRHQEAQLLSRRAESRKAREFMLETPNEKLWRSATSRPADMSQNPSRPLRPSSSRSNVLAAFKPRPPRDDSRAESCAAPAPADIRVNAQWAVKEHTSRKESPPDRFRRKLGFEGCTWRTAAHTAQAEALRITKFRASLCHGRHDDGLDDGFDDGLDDKHQTLMPSRDRENAGRARVGDTHTAEASSHSTLPAADNELRRAHGRATKATASEAAKSTRQTRRESRTARPGRELRRVREQEIAEQPTFALRTAIRNEEPPRTPRRADADLALEARQLEADFWWVLGRTLLQLVCTYSFLFIILGALPAVLCVAWMLCGCSRVRELYLKAMLCPRVCAQGAGCSRLTRRRLWGPRQQCSSSVSY